jgi:MFS transporter, MHS family, metabolite:H+ symporter
VAQAALAPPVREADDPEYATNLRRATLASTVGSALEYDDFARYRLASALIFSQGSSDCVRASAPGA